MLISISIYRVLTIWGMQVEVWASDREESMDSLFLTSTEMIFWLGKPPAPTIPSEIVRIYPLQGYWQNVLVRALNTAWPLGNCLTRKKALKTPIPCCFITLDAQGITLILPTKPTIDKKIDLLVLFWSFGISPEPTFRVGLSITAKKWKPFQYRVF